MKFSYLDLVNQVDSFPNASNHLSIYLERLSALTLFTHGSHTLGYLLPTVLAALKDTRLSGTHWIITASTVSIAGDNVEERSENMRKTAESWRDNKAFKVLAGWRDELYSVYSPSGELYLRMERSAAALFGVVTYGVHMTAYTTSPLRIWTPRRNARKPTYGGMLDNTVAGGIPSGMGVMEALVKESEEEASLPAELVRGSAKAVSVISYFYQRSPKAGGESGLLQPEVQYCYDLEVGEDVIPKPCDDEVQDFHLLTVDEVKEELENGSFKSNCSLVLIDFLIRHSIITPENEPDYIELVSRIHRALEFPLAKAPLNV